MLDRLYDRDDDEAVRISHAARLVMQGSNLIDSALQYDVTIDDVKEMVAEMDEMERMHAYMSFLSMRVEL